MDTTVPFIQQHFSTDHVKRSAMLALLSNTSKQLEGKAGIADQATQLIEPYVDHSEAVSRFRARLERELLEDKSKAVILIVKMASALGLNNTLVKELMELSTNDLQDIKMKFVAQE